MLARRHALGRSPLVDDEEDFTATDQAEVTARDVLDGAAILTKTPPLLLQRDIIEPDPVEAGDVTGVFSTGPHARNVALVAKHRIHQDHRRDHGQSPGQPGARLPSAVRLQERCVRSGHVRSDRTVPELAGKYKPELCDGDTVPQPVAEYKW